MTADASALSLRREIDQDLIVAQKSRDAARLSVLRFLLSAVKYKEVDKKSDLSNDEIIEVVSKQVKTHRESVEAFRDGGREELAKKEEAEIKILQKYLPAQMSEDGVKSQINESLCQIKSEGGTADFASLMKASMAVLKGKADGSLVKKIVEEILKAG